MDLITTTEAETYLGLEANAGGDLLDQLITHISRRLARYTGRLDWGGQSERTEYKDGGTSFITTDYWPIVSIAGIYDDTDHLWGADTAIDSTEYYAGPESDDNGVIFFESGNPVEGWKSVKVVYTGGYAAAADIPGNLKTACLLQLEKDWLRRGATRFSDQESNIQFGLIQEVRELSSPYRRRIPFA